MITNYPRKAKDGLTPHIDEATGNWFIEDVDTGVKAKGTDGKDGTDGVDGITPHIGANGNWFLGDTDTGISASGKSATTIQTITLLATAWVDGTQTVVCSGASADATIQTVTVAADIASKKAYADAGVICTEVGTDELTFTADTAPSVDLVVYVAIEQAGGTVASGPSNDVYSLEETVIGTWIDGKPIYRKLFFVTIASTGKNVVLKTSNALMDACCRLDAIMQNNASGNIKTPASNNEFMRVYESMDGNLYVDIVNSAAIGHTCMVVLEYTKLSDTATIEIPTATALMDAYEEGVSEA